MSGRSSFPGSCLRISAPCSARARGRFRWVALSGDPNDIYTTDKAVMELFPDNDRLHKWMRAARERTPSKGCRRASAGWATASGTRPECCNDLVASGKVSAPIVIGRDHLDCGSVASPYRETEAMADGSDAIADWPLLNALTATSSGAAWVSIHHGGGTGIGRSIQVTLYIGKTGMSGFEFREQILMDRFGIQINKTSFNSVSPIFTIGGRPGQACNTCSTRSPAPNRRRAGPRRRRRQPGRPRSPCASKPRP